MDYEAKYFIYSYIYLDVTLLDLLLFDFHPLSCVAVSTHSRLLSDKSATKGKFLKIPGMFLPPLQSQKVPAADSPSAFQDISSTWMWNKQMPPGCSSQKGFGLIWWEPNWPPCSHLSQHGHVPTFQLEPRMAAFTSPGLLVPFMTPLQQTSKVGLP